MELLAVWPHLSPESREWLIAHSGAALPPSILADLLAANGGSPDSSWWSRDDVGRLALPDDAVDWIESLANGEIAA